MLSINFVFLGVFWTYKQQKIPSCSRHFWLYNKCKTVSFIFLFIPLECRCFYLSRMGFQSSREKICYIVSIFMSAFCIAIVGSFKKMKKQCNIFISTGFIRIKSVTLDRRQHYLSAISFFQSKHRMGRRNWAYLFFLKAPTLKESNQLL